MDSSNKLMSVNIMNKYNNLKYNINKKEALKKISNLSLELRISEPNNFINRLIQTASIMQDNFFHFAAIYEHEDVVKTIIDYLNFFEAKLMCDTMSEFHDKNHLIVSLMNTIHNISKEKTVQLFLENALIKNSTLPDIMQESKIMFTCEKIKDQDIEMILLEGSDLYAIMNCLKMKKIVSSLDRIWVQKSINKDFQWHVKKYFGHSLNVPIDIFQSQQELLTSQNLHLSEKKILSIWTEDIVGARNLAGSLQGNIVFINTHMNFCAGILIPYTKLCKYKLLSQVEYMSEKSNNTWILNPKSGTIYNLFYGGMWQKPIDDMYWEHNGILLANATRGDFEKCVELATEGFRIWTEKSIDSKICILSKLTSILQTNEPLLANEISHWIKLAYYYKNHVNCHQNDKFEVTKIRIPKGVIFLEEKDAVTLFRELTQCLITGNAVIVICNPDVCTLVKYCDIFSTATIPSGVINLISSKIIAYMNYEKILEKSKPNSIYEQLTTTKHIVLCVKMNKRVINIEEYYINLEYKNKDKIVESAEQIHNLTSKLSFIETDNFAYRFLKTASVMEENLNLFMTVCKHVDSVHSILNYLFYNGAHFQLFNGETCQMLDIIGNVLITIYYIYQEYDIQAFLENIINGETRLQWYFEYKNGLFTYLQIEIVLFEDSDLYAVINCLKLQTAVHCLKKIWVEKSIIHNFMWHLIENVGNLNVPIQTFKSKQELFISSTSENMLEKNITINIVSIWSENVTAAKNFARSLNQNLVFINAYIDFPGNMLFLREIFQTISTYFDLTLIDKCTNSSIDPTAHKGLKYDLFYDGMWQKPKKNTYWIHNDILYATATSQDIIDCIESAKRGFKNLSTMSNDSRAQMLSKFATILECNGKFLSSEIVSKWINMSYIYGKRTINSNTERFEEITIYKPKGVVILHESFEFIFFKKLTQNLIIGNSVIVICNPDLYNLVPYCNIFKMCGIPPGVVNLLSIENAINHENTNIDLSTENFVTTLLNFTITQNIIISRK
ncbi:uncharacterized protein LOC114944591 [Nylanderia fulva]|uniref:uncharacterized protein LOC114944591 n=1 Tax=Nylanderia fulva TaxID=613905 RepID=UPI0010FB212D|nr:uncharacterized protein LOC114944591 [Nylanderia fulva]